MSHDSPPIRLLYIAADPALTLLQQGGAGTHMRGTIDPLRAQGFQVETAVGSPLSWQAPSIAQRPAPTLRRTLPRPVRLVARDLGRFRHAAAFRRAEFGAFDCVYERSGYLLDVGCPIARAAGKPYVVETDGILVDARSEAYGAPLGWWANRLERQKLASADLVVVMSEASRDEIAARYDIPVERVYVKGLGVEAELFQQPVSPDPIIDVGWAGTFQPYHGVELLVEALARLPSRSARLIGDGPGRQAIEATVSTARIPVEFTGLLERDAALARLAECRVLVIPESAESMYPVKLLEYAALRRPVVCPRRPAFEEFRNEGRQLLFEFEPGNAEDLARAIDEAAQAPDDRVAELAGLVALNYTWDAVAQRLARRLRALVGSSRLRSGAAVGEPVT